MAKASALATAGRRGAEFHSIADPAISAAAFAADAQATCNGGGGGASVDWADQPCNLFEPGADLRALCGDTWMEARAARSGSLSQAKHGKSRMILASGKD